MGKMFKKAVREKLKLRLALDGPSGSGKSYTALRFAMKLAEHYNTQVAVIETEHRSASKYLGEAPDSIPFEFDHDCLTSFSPTEYTSRIEGAEREGYGVLVIDSLSHAWEGKDGALELVGKKGGNSFTGWKDVTPMHRRMVEAILASKCHIICTMRSKTEYVMEEGTNAQGKPTTVPRKVAMAPIQRAGMEYEFDIYGSMDWSNTMTITKSRCSGINGLITVKPGAGLIIPIAQWLDTGEVVATVDAARLLRVGDEKLSELTKLIAAKGIKADELKKELSKRYQIEQLIDLTPAQAEDFLRKRLGGKVGVARNTVTSPPTQAASGGESSEGVSGNVEESRTTSPGADAQPGENTTDVSTVLAEVSANPPQQRYADPDAIVSKGQLGALNNAIGRFIAQGGSQTVVDKGIAKRNPNAKKPADLTNSQAESLEAAILKILNGPHNSPSDSPHPQ